MACRRLGRGRRRSHHNCPEPCCSTDDQKRQVSCLFLHLNDVRFDGRLPLTLPPRVSNRFRSRLGQMIPGLRGGKRVVL